MNVLSCFVVALGLSMDNFAVAIASGCLCKTSLRPGYILGVSACFVLAHALMLSIGWVGGQELGRIMDRFDHWISFLVLFLIGIKMIKESFEKKEESVFCKKATFNTILILALATSLDALFVGLALSFTGAPFFLTLLLMVCCVFLTSCTGFYLGHFLGRRFGTVVEVMGGVSLMSIGVKVLFNGLGIW